MQKYIYIAHKQTSHLPSFKRIAGVIQARTPQEAHHNATRHASSRGVITNYISLIQL